MPQPSAAITCLRVPGTEMKKRAKNNKTHSLLADYIKPVSLDTSSYLKPTSCNVVISEPESWETHLLLTRVVFRGRGRFWRRLLANQCFRLSVWVLHYMEEKRVIKLLATDPEVQVSIPGAVDLERGVIKLLATDPEVQVSIPGAVDLERGQTQPCKKASRTCAIHPLAAVHYVMALQQQQQQQQVEPLS
uniref:Uncharacterized protein n=1 Tax=Timema cristinae TaxID=61476 RepID=A0A7R9CQ83_TIMCR|nr:unnamed protein product [Timema cristinae]